MMIVMVIACPAAVVPPTLASHPILIVQHDGCGMEHPFGHLGSAVLLLSPPAPQAPPALHCWAATKSSVCDNHSSHAKCKTQHHTSY